MVDNDAIKRYRLRREARLGSRLDFNDKHDKLGRFAPKSGGGSKTAEEMTRADIKVKGPGGSKSYIASYLKEHPKDAKEAGIEGSVIVKFVIGTNGGVQEVEVEQGVYPSLDAEAVRVVKNSPKWRPAIKDGKPVRFVYHFPVIFAIPE